MERIVDQTIPAVVVNNPHVDWNPYANEVAAAGVSDTDEPPPANLEISSAPEPDTRYEVNTDEEVPLLNRAVQAVYAPGSTFKMISFALALDERVMGLRSLHNTPCYGGYMFGNRWFGCWEEAGHGTLDLERALIQSCDTYFYQIAEETTASDAPEIVMPKYDERGMQSIMNTGLGMYMDDPLTTANIGKIFVE